MPCRSALRSTGGMESFLQRWARPLLLLAVNLLYLMLWGFAGLSKLRGGEPPWFADKFGPTFLGAIPHGVSLSFWGLAAAECLALGLACVALARGEFLRSRVAPWLTATLLASLGVFLCLGFGLWLTGDFNGGFQQFVYFGLTLVALQQVHPAAGPAA